MSLYQFTKTLLSYFPGRVAVTFILLLAFSMAEGVGLLLLVPLLELTLPGSSTSGVQDGLRGMLELVGFDLTLGTGLLVFFLVYVTQMALFYAKEASVARNLTHAKLWFRERAYSAIFSSEWQYFARQRRGDLINAMVIESDKAGNAFYQYLLFLTGVSTTIVYAGAAFLISWQFTLALAGIGAALSLLLKGRISGGRELGTTTAETNSRYQGVLGESFDAAKLIKVRGLERNALGLMFEQASHLARLEKAVLINTARLRAIGEPLVVAFLTLGLFVAVDGLEAELPVLLTLVFLFFRLFPRVIKMQQDLFKTLVYIPSFSFVEKVTEEATRFAENYVGGAPFGGLKSKIELQDVHFEFAEGKRVVDGVSLTIAKGDTVGLTGVSGAGKTTIADLVLGLLNPTSGRILIDGRELGDYELKSWRNRLGYVSQDTIMLHDTVRANILWGVDREVTPDELEHIAQLANAHDFIKQMDDGYGTLVGDRGIRLSGGQRQRIALARALASQPDILVLDEATSALDSEAEKRVMTAIDGLSKNVTVLIIAHRLSTLMHTDRLYLLEAGKVAEEGEFNDLVSRGGQFTRLYEMQASGRG
jgi:ATP-binding cassette, subfamily C, bacterial